MSTTNDRIHQLFLLNLSLQLFDGVATYQGMHLWGEGNPLLVAMIPTFGLLSTLLLFKAKACGFLIVLRRLGHRPLVYESMVVLATVYGCLSFLPWMFRFCSLLPV
jgi:hypothetical protein